jgi:hypothetical protein
LPGVKNGAWGCGGACANAGTDISSSNAIATAIIPIRPSGTQLLFWYLKSFTLVFVALFTLSSEHYTRVTAKVFFMEYQVFFGNIFLRGAGIITSLPKPYGNLTRSGNPVLPAASRLHGPDRWSGGYAPTSGSPMLKEPRRRVISEHDSR